MCLILPYKKTILHNFLAWLKIHADCGWEAGNQLVNSPTSVFRFLLNLVTSLSFQTSKEITV